MMRQSKDLFRPGAGLVVLVIALALVAGGAVHSHASKTALGKAVSDTAAQDEAMLVLTRGMAEIIELPGQAADVMVADPSLVDVMALQADRLYVVGLDYGTTNLMAVDERGNVLARMNVHVRMDSAAIQNMIENLFPKEQVEVTATGNQIILAGHVSTPDVSQRIANLVGQYVGGTGTADNMIVNLMDVSGEQQVMLQVRVVEASRTLFRELGIGAGGGVVASDLVAGISSVIPFISPNQLGEVSVAYASGDFQANAFIRALEEQGLVNTLAEPNLTAISGQQAGFLAGGEIPIPTHRDQDGNVVFEWRPFGVGLNFRPVVMSEERISLQLETEVSSLAPGDGITIGNFTFPAFSVRRAETTVELASGGSLMIAGLLQSEAISGVSQLPGIGDIPIIGQLFSSRNFQRDETELVVIITAFLVKPYKDTMRHAEPLPVRAATPLEQSFSGNIRRIYARFDLDPALFAPQGRYGYIID